VAARVEGQSLLKEDVSGGSHDRIVMALV
jgi:hypothetical protein